MVMASSGCLSAEDSNRRTIFVADAHRDGKRFVVRADEILTAFMELETAIRARHSTQGIAERVQVNLDRLPR
jgi:hypothetical protein